MKNEIWLPDKDSLIPNFEPFTDKVISSIDNINIAIDKIKCYQQKIETSKRLWELTFDAVEENIAILDNRGLIRRVNKAFTSTVHKDFTDVTGKLICDIFCQDITSKCENSEEFSPCLCNLRYIKYHDKFFRLQFNHIYNAEKKSVGCVFIAVNITKEKQIEEELNSLKEKYKKIFDYCFDAIVLFDTKTESIFEVNPRACELYGYEEAEFKTLNAYSISAESELSRDVIRKKENHVVVRRHKRKNGEIIFVELSLSYFRFNGQDLCSMVVRQISDKDKIFELSGD